MNRRHKNAVSANAILAIKARLAQEREKEERWRYSAESAMAEIGFDDIETRKWLEDDFGGFTLWADYYGTLDGHTYIFYMSPRFVSLRDEEKRRRRQALLREYADQQGWIYSELEPEKNLEHYWGVLRSLQLEVATGSYD